MTLYGDMVLCDVCLLCELIDRVMVGFDIG